MTATTVVFDGRPARVDLFMVAGVPFTGSLTFTDTDGTALDLSSLSLSSLAVRAAGGTLATATLDTTDADTGVIVVSFTAADATNILGVGDARWYLRDDDGAAYLDGRVTSSPLGDAGVARFTSGGSVTVMAQAWTGAAGAGDLLAANNLSDLDSAATARTNLGLGTAATTAATAYATAAQGSTADTAVQPATLAEKSRVYRFNSGGAQTPNDNRYNDWSDLIDALADGPEGNKHVYLEADFTVPSGAWDLSEATLHGNGLFPGLGGVFLTCPTGVTLTGLAVDVAMDGIGLLSTSTAAIVTVSAAQSLYFTNDAVVGSTTAAFFEVTATGGTQVLFSFRLGSGMKLPNTAGWPGASADYESIDHTGSASLILATPLGSTSIDDDTIRGNGFILANQSAAALRDYDGSSKGASHANSAAPTELGHNQLANLFVGFGTDAKTYVDTEIADGDAAVSAEVAAAEARIGGRPVLAAARFDDAEFTPLFNFHPDTVATESLAAGAMFGCYSEGEPATITEITASVTATSAGASEVVHIGCYEVDADGGPGDLLWSTTLDADTVANPEGTSLSLALPARRYLVVLNPSDNSGAVTFQSAQSTDIIATYWDATGLARAGRFDNTAQGTTLPASLSSYTFADTSPTGTRLRVNQVPDMPIIGGRA